MNKHLLAFALLFSIITTSNAQQIYKGGGTSNSTFLLGYMSYARKSQCIFLPSDLTNAQSGTINRLYYKYGSTNNTSPQVLTNFNIMIGQTTATGFTGNYNFFTGLTPVMSASEYTIPGGTTGTWFPIDLDVAFNYDVTQTLIIQLAFDSSLIQSWGTYGTSNTPVKKIISPDVNAITGDGSSGTWQDMGFDLGPVGINLPSSAKLNLSIYPSPADAVFQLQFQNAANSAMEMQMSDISGRIIKQQVVFSGIQNRIDIGDVDAGVYIVSIKNEGNFSSGKIIIE